VFYCLLAYACQAFVDANGPCEDYSPSQFSARDVHRIALFDMRILNSDRNEANILVQRLGSQCKLIPIDHGYSLPTQLEISSFDWCWYEWPQLNNHSSFPLDDDVRAYILSLDIDADVEMLRNTLGISEEALHLFRISSRLVQRGVEAGLRLKRIASLICRYITGIYFDCFF
jgi:hypothetical protein